MSEKLQRLRTLLVAPIGECKAALEQASGDVREAARRLYQAGHKPLPGAIDAELEAFLSAREPWTPKENEREYYLCWQSRGRVSVHAYRALWNEVHELGRAEWWCGAPMIETWAPGERIVGHWRMRFPLAEPSDEARAAGHDLFVAQTLLAEWSARYAIGWDVALPKHLSPSVLEAGDRARILAAYPDRHRLWTFDNPETSMVLYAARQRYIERVVRIDDDPDPTPAVLRDAIDTERECGELWLVTGRPQWLSDAAQDDAAVCDALCAKVGLGGLSGFTLDRAQALSAATACLARDLAYGSPRMPEARAAAFAERFIDLVAHDARFFSNHMPGGATWFAATRATFDCGICAVHTDRVGLLVVGDED